MGHVTGGHVIRTLPIASMHWELAEPRWLLRWEPALGTVSCKHQSARPLRGRIYTYRVNGGMGK